MTPIGNVESPCGDWKSTLVKQWPQQPSIDSAIKDLMNDRAARAVLSRHIPWAISHPYYAEMQLMSLRMLSGYMPKRLGSSTMKMKEDELGQPGVMK